ncbi:O-acetyl-ADP-ribose deacetylase macrod2 [Coemansia aciculifera]|nr:O-acetyl-ADP-ribose deacetylase macrod2 [Coemansia aciculifera]
MHSPVTLSAIPTVKSTGSGFLTRVSIYLGDITRLQVDGIANAANDELRGGGGVDGAIHEAAGPKLLAECRTLGGCPTGSARITSGYLLPARHVIHAVGPVGEKPELLASAYRASLDLAKKHGLRTVAFPCISAGVYAYPAEPACRVAVDTVRQWMSANEEALDRVVFCVFSEKAAEIYRKYLSTLLQD